MAGKPLFRAGQFGQPMVQSPQHNTIISQQGQMQQRQGYQGLSAQLNAQQGISSGAALHAQQQQNFWGVNNQQQQGAYMSAAAHVTIQSMQAAMNQMAVGFNGSWIYDPWEQSKYTKDEVEMSIGQDAVTNLDDIVIIHAATPVHIIVMFDAQQSALHPERIISISFIDKLRQTKLYKITR